MFDINDSDWEKKVASPDEVLARIEPGMSIFLGTGVSEPRTLVKHLLASEKSNLNDLELIQLVSLGDAISFSHQTNKHKYRLKTFFSGWVANEAITSGSIDLIPCRYGRIPKLVESGAIRIDAAFIQITPPDKAGYASLGVSVDVARSAMKQATLVVGEINDKVPCTMGDTFVHVSEFDYFVHATEPLILFPRWPISDMFDKLAANIASVIEDGSCISFFSGSLFEALGRHLAEKKDLGIHTCIFNDALMDLMKSGAVTNRKKGFFPGKAVTSYAHGTAELMKWLHLNPLVEFQGIDVTADPTKIAINDRMVAILPARKVDLTGGVALHAGISNVTASPGQAQEIFTGIQPSRGSRAVFALFSRNARGESNILPSIKDYPNQFINRESLDIIITEYGVASMTGRSLRERALAIIDIAHPGDRAELVRLAKEANILYADQKYLPESGSLYPDDISCSHVFKGGLSVQFRAIKPSDEEEMRRLFYRFSERTVYYRYFSPIKTMPHPKMQDYVNVDYSRFMSIVATIEQDGMEKIIAEGRYVRHLDRPLYADIAFVVDELYQGRGIALFLLELLIKTARERGIQFFTADVIADNKSMMRVLEKSNLQMRAVMEYGSYNLTMPLIAGRERIGSEYK